MIRRALLAYRRRRAARALAARPFLEGAGMGRRLAYARSHDEPLYLTAAEMDQLRRVVQSGIEFDGLQFGVVAEYSGQRVTLSYPDAVRQEKACRSLDDHGGYPMGIYVRSLIDDYYRKRGI